MTSKLSLRLKLTDFINTDIESKIMEKIDDIHNELHIAVLLHLWFEDGEVTPNKRFQFMYSNTNSILNGLQQFYEVAKFTTSEKPMKKQKRNDYED